jgi:DNA polymerase
MEDLEAIASAVRECTLCALHETRTQAVPGEGAHDASIFMVGEAPGRREDAAGRPFVGAAGKLLDEALREVGLLREEMFITSVLKCRPPGNRNPKAAEMAACRHYLAGQIRLVGPAVIVTLGRYGLRGITGRALKVAEARGRPLEYEGIPVVATYHPAAVMRNRRVRMPEFVADLEKAAGLAGGGR